MITFVTVEEVDALLGDDWTSADKKARSVLMANAWLTGLSLTLPCNPKTHEPVIPDDVKLAGAYAALAAANGGLYTQQSTGVMLSKSVKADSVEVSKTYAEIASNSNSLLDGNLQLALALLQPYGYSANQIRLRRG